MPFLNTWKNEGTIAKKFKFHFFGLHDTLYVCSSKTNNGMSYLLIQLQYTLACYR